MTMMISDKVYEAVVLDEELGTEEAMVKATTESTTNAHSNGNSSTIVPLQHSFKVDETNSDSLPLRRIFIVTGYILVTQLLMTLNMIDHNSNLAMYIAYITAELSFILLILMNLYFFYGAMQIFIVGFVFKSSELSMSEVVVCTLNVIYCCNSYTIYFLVMDEQHSKAERFKAESIFATEVCIGTLWMFCHQ